MAKGPGRSKRARCRELDKAAAGADTADVSIALRLVLMLEKVEYRPR
jgi:hypothetical protein